MIHKLAPRAVATQHVYYCGNRNSLEAILQPSCFCAGCYIEMLGVAIAMLLLGLAVDSEQQTIRLPLLRRPPVFRWFLHVALSTSFPPRLLLLGGDEWCQWGGRTCHPFPPSTWTATLQSPHPHFRPTPGSHASTTAISKKTTVKFVTDAALFALSMEDAFAILRTINRTLIAHNVDSNLNLDLILETYQSDYFIFCDHLYSIFQCLMFCFWEIIIDLHNWNKKMAFERTTGRSVNM